VNAGGFTGLAFIADIDLRRRVASDQYDGEAGCAQAFLAPGFNTGSDLLADTRGDLFSVYEFCGHGNICQVKMKAAILAWNRSCANCWRNPGACVPAVSGEKW